MELLSIIDFYGECFVGSKVDLVVVLLVGIFSGVTSKSSTKMD